MTQETDKLTLIDEEGQEHAFTVLDFVEVESKNYAVLLPDRDPEGGAVIFRVETDENGDEILQDIEDDAEFDRVVRFLEEEDDEE